MQQREADFHAQKSLGLGFGGGLEGSKTLGQQATSKLFELIEKKFDAVITAIDGEGFNGEEKDLGESPRCRANTETQHLQSSHHHKTRLFEAVGASHP